MCIVCKRAHRCLLCVFFFSFASKAPGLHPVEESLKRLNPQSPPTRPVKREVGQRRGLLESFVTRDPQPLVTKERSTPPCPGLFFPWQVSQPLTNSWSNCPLGEEVTQVSEIQTTLSGNKLSWSCILHLIGKCDSSLVLEPSCSLQIHI